MTKNPVYVAALAILLLACAKDKDGSKVRFSYDKKKFRAESALGCTADTMKCAYYEVSYPEFSGLDSAVAKQLANRIDASVSMGNPEAGGQSMKEIAEGFIEDYLNFSSEIPDAASGWHYSAEIAVEVLTDTLLSLSTAEEFYTGGAHGGNGMYFININPVTGADFTLSNLLKPGYEGALTTLGEKIFRSVRELPDTSSLSENYFEFPDDKFALNQNYGFTTEGIVFYYNSYEIAPYASGPTRVLIPYSEIKEWVK